MDSPTVTDETATGTAAPADELDPSATAATEGADATDTAEGADADKQNAPTEPEKPAWEKKLDALLDEPKEGDEPKKKDAPADEAAKDAPKSEPKADPAKEDDDADEPLVARFPGRQPEDPELEVTIDAETKAFLEKKGIDAQQLVERANQATNGYARRQQIEAERADIEASRAELDAIEAELAASPVDFMVDKIDAKQYTAVAEALLTRMSDEEFNAVLEKVATWEGDPSERKVAAAKAREDAVTRKMTQREAQESARSKAAYLSAVQNEITALIPEDMPEDEAKEFYDFAAHKILQWARRQPKGSQKPEPDRIHTILAEEGALEPYGLTLPTGKPEASRTQGKPGPKSPAKAGDVAARAKARGQELKERRERRQNAVTVPAGAGAEAANTRPPKGQTFEQRISWIEKFGLGGKK